MLGWVPRVAPVVTQAAVGAGHWAAGRRRRALAAWTSAAGYGLVAWGLGTEAPTPAEVRENMEQNIQRLQREGALPKPGTTAPAAARTPTPAARRLERHLSRVAPVFRYTDTPQYRLASTVAGMVIGVWWGLRWPRRLTVLVIVLAAPNAVFLGTDATERWDKAAFQAFAHPYFAKGKAWTFTPRDRHIDLSHDGRVAWFDELLDSATYGECRGSGVLEKTEGGWKITQYNLTIPMPNDLAKDLVARIREAKQASKPH